MLLPCGLLIVAAYIHGVTSRVESAALSPYPVQRPLGFRETAAYLSSQARLGVPSLTADLPVEFDLERGGTLGKALERLGVEPLERQAISEAMAEHWNPRQLRPGYDYTAFFGGDEQLSSLKLTRPGRGVLEIRRAEGGWSGRWLEFERSYETRAIRGALDGSLEGSVRRAGGEAAVTYRMADVLQWDLDFNRDLRRGDEFEVLYESVWVDGAFDSVGAVHALVYVNRGVRLEAYRYGEEGGYYDADGRPIQKLFLRSPLRYSRVTSSFNPHRFHPVMKRRQPHWGVDYGAPTGTPVRVTAGGVVQFAGWDSGGGKTIKVRHTNDYLSGYLHLSGFAKGIRSGVRVRQGDVIGYVGSTGLATGPHLDYRVQHNGRWIDPQLIPTVPAKSLSEEQTGDFLAQRDRLRARLAGAAERSEGLETAARRVPVTDAPSRRQVAAR